MPLYQYYCQSCDKYSYHLINVRYINVPMPCEECKDFQTRVEMAGGTSFQLKGDGWAKDGYTKNKKSEI